MYNMIVEIRTDGSTSLMVVGRDNVSDRRQSCKQTSGLDQRTVARPVTSPSEPVIIFKNKKVTVGHRFIYFFFLFYDNIVIHHNA